MLSTRACSVARSSDGTEAFNHWRQAGAPRHFPPREHAARVHAAGTLRPLATPSLASTVTAPFMTVPKDYPDHHDAELVLKLYELRREGTMRESRATLNAQFWPKTFDEVLAITKTDHPLNAAFRQCGSYWEMTYAMAKHGVVHGDFMMESNGEGLLLFARIEPFLAEYRETINAAGFRNAEWVANETAMGRQIMGRFRTRVQKLLAER